MATTYYTGDAYMHWNMNQEADLAGYIVYLGDGPRQYNRFTTNIGLTATTAQPGALINRVANGIIQYFTVSAYDLTGNESTWGAEVSLTKNLPLLHVLRQVK